jgi:hypothetical protein
LQTESQNEIILEKIFLPNSVSNPELGSVGIQSTLPLHTISDMGTIPDFVTTNCVKEILNFEKFRFCKIQKRF